MELTLKEKAMKIGKLIENKPIFCAKVGQNIQEVVSIMVEHNIGSVTVLEGDKIVGIFTERDLMNKIVGPGKIPSETKIEDVMTRELIVVPPDYDSEDCIRLMGRYKIRHLPVIDKDELKGIISLRDLLREEAEDKTFEVRVLKEYIHYMPPFAVPEKKQEEDLKKL